MNFSGHLEKSQISDSISDFFISISIGSGGVIRWGHWMKGL